MDLKFPLVDQVLLKSIFRLDLYDFEPPIVDKKYIASVHSDE